MWAQYADFIDQGADLPDEDDVRRARQSSRAFMQDENEDVEDLERRINERYRRPVHIEYGEDATDVEQQSLLPSVKDPKLWMVKCAVCFLLSKFYFLTLPSFY